MHKEQPSLSKKKKKDRCDMSQTKTVVADNTTPADNRAENEFHDS
jgi:hypothetical protein